MKNVRWVLGAILLVGIIVLVMIRPFPFLTNSTISFTSFFGRAMYILLLSCTLCLYRVFRGPTGADRIVAIDMFGIMIVGFCSLLTIATGRSWYIDIGIAWALQSFIATLALSKYLEGKGFDE